MEFIASSKIKCQNPGILTLIIGLQFIASMLFWSG